MLLANCAHLADIDSHDLVGLARSAVCRLAFEGERIFVQGGSADRVFILLDGAVTVERSSASGSSTSYEVFGPYATFGDLALLGEPERRYTATTRVDSVFIELPAIKLVEVLSANPPQALAWRGAIMARLHRKEPNKASSFDWRILGKLPNLFAAA